jgi:hypothetical protein
MNINDLTIGEAKQLAQMFGGQQASANLDDFAIGKWVIVRTDRAGVWFGKLIRKAGKEIILNDARRMYYFKCIEGISLSSLAVNGVHSDSKIAVAVPEQWLEAIEIMPVSDKSFKSISEAPNAKA